MIGFWTLLQLIAVFGLLYYYIRRKYSYWSDKGVPGPRPIFPFGYVHLRTLHKPDYIDCQLLKKHGRVYGLYTGLVPTLSISDAELIKQVLVKDFPSFLNRRTLNPYHEIWNVNMFFNVDEHWKRLRSITTPAFTTGKLRGMYGLMGNCIDRLDAFLAKTSAGNGLINTKEAMAGFTIDVIAQSAFATITDANGNQAKKNPFVYHGLNLFRFNPFKLMICLSFPRPILNLLKFQTFFPSDSFQFFVDLTRSMLKQRQEQPKGVKSPNDLIQLMVDSYTYEEDLATSSYDSLAVSLDAEDSKTEKSDANCHKTIKKMTTTEIIAQCILFFIAGFETTASALTFIFFELATNEDIQERLLEELRQQLGDLDPKQTGPYYDAILNHCPYLDAIAHEALRKYPPVIRLERQVMADSVTVGGVRLKKGDLIEVPTMAVHYDPAYYPEPEVFRPERFLPENKDQLVPYSYIPFGQGPRNCVGMRFAYQEMKLCVAIILQRYRFSKTHLTPEKLEFRRGQLMMNCVPFELKVEARK